MKPKNQPYQIVPDQPLGDAEELPVIRLEKKDTPESHSPAAPQGKKAIPASRREQSPRSADAAPVPFVERQAVNSEGIEKVWGSQHEGRAPLPTLRISIFAFLIVALIIGGLGFYYRPEEKKAQATHARLSSTPATATPADDEVTEAEAADMVKRMQISVRGYCAAKTVEERAKYVREPERVKILMQGRYPDGKVSPIKIGDIDFNPLTMEKRADFWLAAVDTPQGSKTFIVELPEKGAALIDWEVDTQYQPYDWDRFVHEAPNGEAHEFRVHVALGFLFSHEFSDEKRLRCYVVSAPNSEAPLFGYCEIDSPSDRKLMDLLRRNNSQPAPVILQLKRPTGTLSPQGAIIESVINESWVYIKPLHPDS